MGTVGVVGGAVHLCATISWKEHQGGAVDAIALPTQGGRGARKEDAVVEHIAEVSAATRAAQLTLPEAW